ncbi:MAG: P-aminobenzoate N-oxygenase AurF, partial [Microcystaceae cyanobacterium]
MTPLKNLPTSSPYQSTSLFQKDPKTYSKLQLNYRRAKQTDHSPDLDTLADRFDYEQCQGEYWQPEEFSLLYGTPLWQQSSSSQRLLLNQLYW